MFNKHQKHPCMQKISIFYRKTKKLRRGAPGEEYQTGPLVLSAGRKIVYTITIDSCWQLITAVKSTKY
jgi:hypothetical protein